MGRHFRRSDGLTMSAHPGSMLERHLERDGDWTEIDAPASETQPDDGLDSLTRDELNQRAGELGITDAETMPNKGAVVDAIRTALADNGGDGD